MTDLIGRPSRPVDPRRAAATSPASTDPSRRYGTLAGRASLYVVGTGLALVGAHAVGIPTPPCPLRASTGFPCPFCGLTHVARELLTGHVAVVARHDPAALVLAAVVGVAVLAQLAALARRTTGPVVMTSRVAGGVVLVVLAVHWLTTIVTGGMFAA
jgi:hypothetical protein